MQKVITILQQFFFSQNFEILNFCSSEIGVRRTSHSGLALKEGNHINQGLLCVAKVIKALSSKAKVIPYRDTILTTALQGMKLLFPFKFFVQFIHPLDLHQNKNKKKLIYSFDLLLDSLNLNSYMILLACISPYRKDFNETMSTLRFLRNAKTMKITPVLNAVIMEYKVINSIFNSI